MISASDLDQLFEHYDRLAGYEEPERPQETLFCGPVAEETWRMRRKLKTGMHTHMIRHLGRRGVENNRYIIEIIIR